MQFGSMPGRGITDALFVVQRRQEEYRKKKKLSMCFVDIEKAFDSLQKGDKAGNEKERFIKENCKSSDQPQSQGKTKV